MKYSLNDLDIKILTAIYNNELADNHQNYSNFSNISVDVIKTSLNKLETKGYIETIYIKTSAIGHPTGISDRFRYNITLLGKHCLLNLNH